MYSFTQVSKIKLFQQIIVEISNLHYVFLLTQCFNYALNSDTITSLMKI